jgi:hypothetical protein
MAVRTKLRHDENTKAKIKASQLVNFLQNHVLTGSDVKKTQITAAVALLKKVLPDLASVDGSMNVTHHHEDILAELETAAGVTEPAHDAAYH